jgi:hypothetical protein
MFDNILIEIFYIKNKYIVFLIDYKIFLNIFFLRRIKYFIILLYYFIIEREKDYFI